MNSLLHTDIYSAEERFTCWRAMLTGIAVPVDFCVVDTDDFDATARMTDVGTVQISSLVVSAPMRAHRSRELIRRNDPEVYHLGVNLRGRSAVSQHGRDAVLDAGHLVLCDSSHPFRSWAWPDATRTSPGAGLLLQLPRVLLPLPADEVVRLAAVPLSARSGMGALVSRYAQELVAHRGAYSSADRTRLATVTVDLVAAMLASELDIDNKLCTESQHGALLARVGADIQERLGDPDLSADMIAARHHVSCRTLYRIFEANGSTIGDWIRTSRLARCRRDLADPRLRNLPIQVIAARWGFASAAHFSRVFRAAHAVSPQEYRRRTQSH
jgi:AraC-like DNA-binding protein